MISLILGLILGAISVLFAFQNVFPVTVSFLSWEITGSLALVILLSALSGLLVGILFTIPNSIKDAFAISRLKKDNQKLEKELEEEKTKAVISEVKETNTEPTQSQ